MAPSIWTCSTKNGASRFLRVNRGLAWVPAMISPGSTTTFESSAARLRVVSEVTKDGETGC